MSEANPERGRPGTSTRAGAGRIDDVDTASTAGAHLQREEIDVLIAGGGPVGLVLANLLGKRGLRVLVIERRIEPPQHSMAIGITPPSLSSPCSGLVSTRRSPGKGCPSIRPGFSRTASIWVMWIFRASPAEHRFILSLPQSSPSASWKKTWAVPSVKLSGELKSSRLHHDVTGVKATLRETSGKRGDFDGYCFVSGRMRRPSQRNSSPGGYPKAGTEVSCALSSWPISTTTRTSAGRRICISDVKDRWSPSRCPMESGVGLSMDTPRSPDSSRVGDNRVVEIVRQRTGFDLSSSVRLPPEHLSARALAGGSLQPGTGSCSAGTQRT